MIKKVFILVIVFISFSKAEEKVVLQLDWKHQFEYAGYYVAKEKGFYKKIGVDLEIREFNGEDPVTALINRDDVNFGSYNSRVVLSKMRGEPVVLLANIFKKSALVLVSQKDIRTPLDFFGKRVMGASDQLKTDGIGTLFQRFNLKSDNYTQVDPTFRVDEFVKGEVDVMTAYISNELFHLNEAKVEYNIIDPANYGIYMYGDSLFTKESELEQHRERTEKFVEASIKGWEYALNNIDETVNIILDKYNSQNKSREALQFEAEETMKMVMPNVYPIGSIERDRIKSIEETFIEIGANDSNYSMRNFLLDDFVNNSIEFNTKERAFLSSLKEIKMCVDPNWMPYEKIENSKHIGMSGDFIKLISEILDLPINLIETESWSESLKALKNGRCDILSLLRETDERKKFLSFTEPYFSFPLVIATATDELFISNLHDIKNRTLGVVKDYATSEVLREKYPYSEFHVKFKEVENIRSGLEMVANRELFGFVDTLPTIGYIIQKEFQSQLKVAGKLSDSWELSIGVRKELQTLRSILDKAVRAVPESEKQQIINRWISVKYETSSNFDLLIKIVVIFIVIIILFGVKYIVTKNYNRMLELEVEKQLEELRKKDVALINQNKLASMGEMVGSIAHQWKQPLNVLSMNIQMLVDDYEDGLIDEDFINKFRDDNIDIIKFMVTTIDDFRNFFRVEKEKQKFNVKDAIGKIAEMQKAYLRKRNIHIDIIGDGFNMFGFKTEFQQVILNLVNNAKDEMLEKEMKDGVIEIETDSDGTIKVRDNAGGVPSDIIDKIFNPYFTTKEEGKGTGIGLHMSKTIIEDHLGGKLSVSNIENGAEFTIKFKVLEA